MFVYVFKAKNCDLYLLFDDEDKYILDIYFIYYNEKTGYFLCYSKIDKTALPIYLHRLIGKIPYGQVGDHINGNVFDFRRTNIQAISQKDNTRKQKKTAIYKGKQTSSIYKGVCWNKKLQKWYSSIRVSGVLLNLGNYPDPQVAATVYNNFAKRLFGEFTNLNQVEVTKHDLAQVNFEKLNNNARLNLIKHGKTDDAAKLSTS